MKKTVIGLAALLILTATHIFGQSAVKLKSDPLTSKQIRSIVDTVCSRVEQVYVYIDKGKQISDHLHAQLKAGAYNKYTDPNDLSVIITNDMRKVCYDGHLAVQVDGSVPKGPVTKAPANPKPEPQPKPNDEENFNLKKIEILPGNVGYFRLDGFTANRDVWPVLENALHFLERSRALIFDVRYNGGGMPGTVNLLECYLFNKKTEMNGMIDRSGKDTTHIEADPEAVKNFTLNMPIYIITSRRTYSAAEDFAYGMQSVHRAQIVGDTTGGGAHPVQTIPVGYGLSVRIPCLRSYNPYTHTNWEGTGVIPDIPCPEDSAIDVILSKVYQQVIAESTDAAEKHKYQWLKDKTDAKKVVLAPQILQNYTGTFGRRFSLSVKDGRLNCTDLQKKYDFELYPAGADTFYSSVENGIKLTFIKSSTGTYSSFKAIGLGGREAVMDKAE
ncbi:hypothetical protein D0C36_12690 [Mucilaginibacter conchicola]|uniref:Tail specific protease domain-containing protein n=1 Tax=Mucilaginibacter conchicola TaxID=2303333 RepID=A0A372NUC0_9SPHI|nr:S41 family peptidase [Mucilaginibacter conchicola]RFZ92289.1 hypothetical protein D0C36_12690 [Mucilaginibacter conchicola]